jgi:hypothetical protein
LEATEAFMKGTDPVPLAVGTATRNPLIVNAGEEPGKLTEENKTTLAEFSTGAAELVRPAPVIVTPVKLPLVSSRLVTFAFKTTTMSVLKVPPGPPVHDTVISPICSVKPST